MRKRKLGQTDIELSELSLGTWGLATGSYGQREEGQFREVVRRALELEVTTIDMAPVWGDGEAERVVGEAIRDRRDDVQLVTRAGRALEGDRIQTTFEEEQLVEQCEGSLERLGTDRIDLWMLHNPTDDTWASTGYRLAQERLTRDGKIRAWGASVTTMDQALSAVDAGADAVCLPYNLLQSDELHDLSGELSEKPCGVLARSPLAHGLLTGLWSESRTFLDGDHRADRWSPKALRTRVRQVNALRFLVHGDVASLTSAALRYVLTNSLVTTAVVGAGTVEQLESAAEAAKGPPYLPETDLARLSQVLAAAGV